MQILGTGKDTRSYVGHRRQRCLRPHIVVATSTCNEMDDLHNANMHNICIYTFIFNMNMYYEYDTIGSCIATTVLIMLPQGALPVCY